MKIGENSSNKENCPTNFKKSTTSYHYTLLLLLSVQLCPILCDPMDCSTPGHPAPHHVPEFAQVLVHCIGDAVKPSHPLTPSSSALNLSQHQGFSNEFSVLIRWWRYWSFSFSISPSSEYSGLISLKIDWFELLAAHGTFRSLLQHHSSKASILWCPAFFQLSQLYVTNHGLKILKFHKVPKSRTFFA